MSDVSLTYAITTYNRLPFLREGLGRLLASRRPDEEIVIVDGGSTDGTVEFLTALAAEKKIDCLVSERDHGQGHGINKAFLRARGDLVKPINDDDLYDFAAIAAAREYMQATPQVDVLSSRAQVVVWQPRPHLIVHDYFTPDAFPVRTRPFPFGDIGMMVRRESLALLGIFSPQIAWIDYEYSLRATSTVAVVAYMNRTTGIRLTNDGSKSVRFYRQLLEERRKIDSYYQPPWQPSSFADRLRAVKARTKAILSQRRRRVKQVTAVATECPPPSVAFTAADALLKRVREEEQAAVFVTSSWRGSES
jgi:glycosyltransferase involved in cell wall biosynthesis